MRVTITVWINVAVHIEISAISADQEFDIVCMRVANIGTEHEAIRGGTGEALLIESIWEKFEIDTTTNHWLILLVSVLND